ncbi:MULTISPECIES: DUF6082 family protein [unclassified Streptomyces]|uniref:DUF6082 family protein n=1 Tax=unclassified Streptomyces TaxID=2593676 RepID=UPI000CD50272|nr:MULTISPECIES: DUF6082 family protein [unclassified Streptomyces]AWL37122.1 peptide transporter permease SapC [Streptomyces sp. SM18]
MKLTTSVLAAGTAVSLATIVVGAARLRQDARHQAERNEALLAGNQLAWLAQVSTNHDLAEIWKPEDMETEEYMRLMSSNRLLCMLSLRDRLGFVPKGHLPFHAEWIMKSDVSRRYWKHFGDLRAQEAEGNERAKHFTRVLSHAAKNTPLAQPAAV